MSSFFRPILHRFTLDMTFTEKITIDRGSLDFIDCAGPDLGLLMLSTPQVNTIMAYKSFYNLAKRRNQILADPPQIDEGVWFICGMPEEWTNDEPPEKGYQIIKEFRGLCGAGIVKAEQQRDKLDYLYFETKYNKSYEGPQMFQGVSGGGLWQIIVVKSQNGELIIKDKILSGVVFFQSDLENGLRMIKCHGRRSIYGEAIDILIEKTP